MPETAETPGTTFTWTRRHVTALTVPCLAALLDTIDVTVVNVAHAGHQGRPALLRGQPGLDGQRLHGPVRRLAAAAAALTLLREDGRGQAVNLVELQAAGA